MVELIMRWVDYYESWRDRQFQQMARELYPDKFLGEICIYSGPKPMSPDDIWPGDLITYWDFDFSDCLEGCNR